MRVWTKIGALAAVILLGASLASAEEALSSQYEGDPDEYVRHDARDWEDEARYAFGIGLGLISLDEPGLVDDVEPYLAASLRIAIGPHHRGNRDAWRGYLEPELGYWESSAAGPVPSFNNISSAQVVQTTGRTDLLLGLNIVGVMPWRGVDFFIGAGAGIHFIDFDQRVFTVVNQVAVSQRDESVSDEALGVNAHFGVDVSISRRASFFGVGRFDIVDDGSNALDAKAYVGLRFRFGGHRARRWSPDDE